MDSPRCTVCASEPPRAASRYCSEACELTAARVITAEADRLWQVIEAKVEQLRGHVETMAGMMELSARRLRQALHATPQPDGEEVRDG